LYKDTGAVRYSVEQGLVLENGKREVSPEIVARELSTGKLSKDLALLTSM